MTKFVRPYECTDLDRVMTIWRAATAVAHPFQTNADLDRDAALIRNDYMPQVDSWVAESEDGQITGFISLADKLIVALFVDPIHHRTGIGGRLIAYVNALYGPLSVEVFAENAVGVSFYEKHGFLFVRAAPNPLYPDREQWIMAQPGADSG